MATTIEISNLTKDFGTIKAVNNVSLKFEEGEIVALLGPNGAGKSTLMNMITGYLTPSSGEIKILKKPIENNSLEAKQNIGFLPEGSPLYPDMSVKQFLNYMAKIRFNSSLRGASATWQSQLNKVVELAKINEVLNQKIETLSKGYLRRVGFAQSILSDPKILLLDEPTDGLDPNQKEHIRELISKMGKNKTILISTHLLEEAETIANRIIIINKGTILADGTLAEILKKSKTKTLEDAFKRLTK